MDGKAIDWAEYSDDDIERFIIELEDVRKKRRETKREALKTQIEGMVKEHGISLAELFPNTGKVRGQPREKRTPAGQQVKYRNPVDPSQTWSGKGRKPAWLIEALTSDKTLEDFAV